MAQVFIGLGSNLDDPLQQVTRALFAIHALPQTQITGISAWYESLAIGPGVQPNYVNGVAAIATSLLPLELLDHLQKIEQQHKRVRQEHWGPRTLDLDILLYGDQVILEPRLQIPHPHLQARNFVVYPLLDVAPQLMLPSGHLISALAAQLGTEGLRRLPVLPSVPSC